MTNLTNIQNFHFQEQNGVITLALLGYFARLKRNAGIQFDDKA